MSLTVRLDPQTLARLDRLAARRGTDRSAVVRDALARVLDEEEAVAGRTFYDDVADLVGCVESGVTDRSVRTGERFRRLREERRARRPR